MNECVAKEYRVFRNFHEEINNVLEVLVRPAKPLYIKAV